jgi:hypothetical protein
MSNDNLEMGMVGCLTILHVLIELLNGLMVFAAMVLGVLLVHWMRPSRDYVRGIAKGDLNRRSLELIQETLLLCRCLKLAMEEESAKRGVQSGLAIRRAHLASVHRRHFPQTSIYSSRPNTT